VPGIRGERDVRKNAKNGEIAKITSLAAAATGLPLRHAARHAARAHSHVCLGHGPMPYVRVLCSYDAHTGEEMHGWSVVELGSRVGSVEVIC